MKLSPFVFAAATLTTANALNLRVDNDDKRSLQDLEGAGVFDVTTHGEAHEDLEVYCKEQVSTMRSIVDNFTEGIVSMAMERVSNTKVADAIVTEDTCMIMGCTGERRLFSLELQEAIQNFILTIQGIVQGTVQAIIGVFVTVIIPTLTGIASQIIGVFVNVILPMITPIILGLVAKLTPLLVVIINESPLIAYFMDLLGPILPMGGASLTDIVDAFAARITPEIDTANTEAVTEVTAETEKVAASEVIIGEALAIEDGNVRKLQSMGLLDSLFTLVNGLRSEPESAVQLIFTFLLGLVGDMVTMAEAGVNYAPSAFAAVNDDASQMVKDLLEDVNVNDLLEIISGSIEEAKAMEITPFSMETAAQIEPCVNTFVAGAEEEANSIISLAVGEFCTSFCEN